MKRLKKIMVCLLIVSMTLGTFLSQSALTHAEEKKATVTVDVTQFGADPTGTQDSTKAIQAAFAEAKRLGQDGSTAVTVNFPNGEYHIYKDYAEKRMYHTSNTNSIESPEKTIGILIEDQQNLTVEGNGSLFMMHGNMMALAVVRSKNITLHDFSWDFAVPTVSEMTVIGMGKDESGKPYTDFFIPKCFPYEITGNTLLWKSEPSPYTGEPYWTEKGIHNAYSIVAYFPDEEMTRAFYTSDTPFNGVADISNVDDTTLRITYTTARPSMQKMGMVMELASSAYRETAGAFIWESENVTSRKINVHFMHGFGWLVQMSRDVYYYDCNLMPREKSGHVTVGYADGIHASGAAGDLVIENCNFSNTHDDPINLHGTFTRVEQKIDNKTLKLCYIHAQQGGFPQFHEGDQVVFFTRNTLESTDGETMYTVEKVISNPGEDGNDLRTMIIRFAEELPDELSETIAGQPKYVAENITYAPKVTIRNCTFKNVPTRGILCTTRNKVLIENNTFLNMSMATIYLSNDSNEWYESGPIRDMTIRNNTFYIKSIGRTSWEYAPAVYVHPVTLLNGLPSEDNPIHKNITIEDNTFHMDVDTVVKAESVENLTIRNNQVLRTNPKVQITLSADKTAMNPGESSTLKVAKSGDSHTREQDNVYEFTKCKNVILEGNTYDDGLKKYAVLSDMSEQNLSNRDTEIKVANNRLQAVTDPVSKIFYESSDPQVLAVDDSGNLQAKKAGSAVIRAYYPWNGTKIYSNELAFNVSGENTAATSFTELASDTIAAAENIAVPELAFAVENPEENSWNLYADKTKKNVTISVKAAAGGQAALYYGAYRKPVELQQNGEFLQAAVELENGINSFYIQITAKDGITTKQYMLHICHASDTQVDLRQIKINGTNLPEFQPEKEQYTLWIPQDMEKGSIEAVSGGMARICLDGQVLQQTAASTQVNWKKGCNKVQVIGLAEDGISRKTYEIDVIRPYEAQADIYRLLVNGQDQTDAFVGGNIEAEVTNPQAELKLQAQNPQAQIRVSNGQTTWIGTGELNKEVELFKETPEWKIEIVSADGSACQTGTLRFEKAAYLSDLTYEDGATVGFDTINMDRASSGKAIRLANEEGQPVVYEKGIGTHADSTIIYRLDGTSYDTLTGVAGVDYEKFASEYAAIQFRILANGEERFQSGVMNGSTAGKAFEIPLKGVTELTLEAVQRENKNWDAHADWAQMKLTGAFPNQPEVPVYQQTLEKSENGQIFSNVTGQIREGSNVLYTFLPTAGYQLKRAFVNDREVQVEKGVYFLENVREAIRVTAEFEIIPELLPDGGTEPKPEPEQKPGQVQGLQMKKTETKAITISWKSVAGAQGYEIQRKKNAEKAFASLAVTNQTTYRNTKLSEKDTCVYRVRAYRTVNGKKLYGDFSADLQTATKPGAPKLRAKATAGSVKLTWKKKAGVDKYVIYRSEGKGKLKKFKTLSGKKRSLKVKTQKGKTYLFRMKAVKLAGKKAISSKASKKCKVMAK